MILNAGQAETSGFGGSSRLSMVLVLFILLCIVVSTFLPNTIVAEEAANIGAGSVEFHVINNTGYAFFMYKISGDIAQNPTSFNLRPNGGSTTVFVVNPSPVGLTKVTSSFLVHNPRFGGDFDRDGLVIVTMAVRETTIGIPYRRFDSVQIARAPLYNPIGYLISGLTLTFNNL
ncbi:hypothetical protein [Paenibacillus herberti]|uniref:Uncharacterized protein n=1 Tax=Paenibacillus herberti TaxID=1619309 RepID=A0A229NU92_9BACL|nr:hypothetical protein [Paenibacillus herberti]OXM13453.1 hypothetical protein CGZ75_20620 [Paenibacillus herberti]